MTLRTVDKDEAPPPYTVTDPLTPNTSVSNETPAPSVIEEVPAYDRAAASAANFISALPYFEERPPTVAHGPEEEVLEHSFTIYTRSQAKDYSRFPRCWRSRSKEVTQHDWQTFLNYLLPLSLGPASNHPNLPQKLRREIERDHKDRPQETDEERKARITAVSEEWNIHFFGPRAMRMVVCFAPEVGATAPSPLCPKCYPSTVRALPLRHGPPTINRSQTAPPASEYSIPRKPVGGAHTGFRSRESGANTQGHSVDPQSSQAQNYINQSYMGSWASTIQNWANDLSEQAQRYGEHVERQAEEHGRRIEERAEAFGRMVEAKGEACENYFEQQGQRIERAGESFEDACSRRSPWMYPWNPSGPLGRGRGGCPRGGHVRIRGSPWVGAVWTNTQSGHHPGQRRGSVSSLSSCSSSSSSSSDSDLDDSHTSEKEGETVPRPETERVRQQRAEARHLGMEYRAKAAALRHEMGALRVAHREVRSTASRRQGRGSDVWELSRAKAAEAHAIKHEMWNLKREYKAMKNEFKQERKQVRHAIKVSRKEQKRARKTARKTDKKERKGKGKQPQKSELQLRPLDLVPVNNSSNISLPRQITQPISLPQPPLPALPVLTMPELPGLPELPGPPVLPVLPVLPGLPGHASRVATESQETLVNAASEDATNRTENPTKDGSKSKNDKEAAPPVVGWGWTRDNAASKSSGFRKKKQEITPPSVQWSGDGKQESGVLSVDEAGPASPNHGQK